MSIKKLTGFILTVFLFVTFINCTEQKSAELLGLSESEKKEITDSVISIMNRYANTQNNLEYIEIPEQYYLNSSDFKTYLDGEIYSYSDMKNITEELAQLTDKTKVTWDTIVVTPINKNSAIATAPFKRTDVDTSGKLTKSWGVANWVWVRHENGWKAIYGQGNHYPGSGSVEKGSLSNSEV